MKDYNELLKDLKDILEVLGEWEQVVIRLKDDKEESKEEIKEEPKKDIIVERVIEKFRNRSEVWIKKYWTTLEDNNTDDFLKHLQEELADWILYVEKLMSQKNNFN